jgi:hypothetical protein
MQEIERAQGGWPWDWLAFRSPAGLVALGLLLACARIEPDAPAGASGLAGRVESPSGVASAARGPWLAAACRAHRLIVLGLASTLLLGGWLLPGVSPAVQAGRPVLELAGAAWLLAKTCGLMVLLAWAREALPRRGLVERTRRTALGLAPLSAAGLAASVAWTWWGPTGGAQLLVSGALVGGACLAALALAHRVHHGLVAPGGDGRLSPFL